MFGDIPQNVWWHSPEYNILLIPHVPRIPLPVPVFLVLYIADLVSIVVSNKEPMKIILLTYFEIESTVMCILYFMCIETIGNLSLEKFWNVYGAAEQSL